MCGMGNSETESGTERAADSRVVCLHPDDNVVVLTQAVPAGARVEVAGVRVELPDALGLGHKLARKAIPEGERIVKYGVPIGSATEGIEQGAHVHLHNMRSDYLPTFTLDEERKFTT